MSWMPGADPELNTDCPDAVEVVIVPRTGDLGEFEVRRALPSRKKRMVGPFIFWDEMGPGEFLTGKGIDDFDLTFDDVDERIMRLADFGYHLTLVIGALMADCAHRRNMLVCQRHALHDFEISADAFHSLRSAPPEKFHTPNVDMRIKD